MIRISTPLSSRCVAKLCLSVWTLMLGECSRCGALALEGADCGLARRDLAERLIFACRNLHFLEAELELVNEAPATFGALSEQLDLHLRVLQFEERIACFEVAVYGLDASGFGLGMSEARERFFVAQNPKTTAALHGMNL